jgi:hypothetical protein
VAWEVARCPTCGEEFEPEVPGLHHPFRSAWQIRRDSEPHRGALIANLGNASLAVGGLSLCFMGVGAVLSVPLGIVAVVLARRDLARMRSGLMDPGGRRQTEIGLNGGIAGIVLGLIFAAFYVAVYLHRL